MNTAKKLLHLQRLYTKLDKLLDVLNELPDEVKHELGTKPYVDNFIEDVEDMAMEIDLQKEEILNEQR